MATQDGSALARRLEFDAGDRPANLRSLLATGPVRNPRATDVHRTVAAANDVLDDDAEATLTWEPKFEEDAIEIEIELSEIEDDGPSVSSANEPPPQPVAVAAPPTAAGRIHLVIGGLGLLATALAFVAVGRPQPAAVVTTPSAAIAPAAIPAAKPTQPAAPAVESVVAPAQLEVPDEASPIDDEVVDEEVIEISSEPSGPTWTERRALRRAQRMYEDGVAAMRRGQRQAAIELYRQALALRPKHALAAGALSDVYFDEGRFDFAVAYAEDAVKADFDTPAHHIRLGDAYVRTGSLDDARAQYRTARQLGSTRADDRLAKLSQSSGR